MALTTTSGAGILTPEQVSELLGSASHRTIGRDNMHNRRHQ